MSYYNIEEYPIVTGNPNSGVALCTGWQDAFTLVEKYPTLSDTCAIIGSLYIAQGINAVIRNLTLNPGIRVVYLWRQGKESLSQRGIRATNMLLQLWKKGVNNARRCDDFTLEKEIPTDILDRMREAVEIRIIDEIPGDALSDTLEHITANPYMEPQEFPDPIYETPDVFPSEQAGFLIRQKTIYETWLEVLFHIERFGEHHKHGMPTKRLRSCTWIAEDQSESTPDCPHIPETLQRNLSVSPDLILEYVKEHFLQYGNSQTSAYTYGNRLCRWGGLFDQVDTAITTLREYPNTRRLFLSTLIPSADLLEQSQPPCLVGVQFLKDSTENLDVLAVFRSHDIFQAGLSNAFGILCLLRYVAHEAGMQRGKIVITSNDAHIYMRDIKDARQVVQCAWGNKSPELSESDMDPRGSFLVRIANEEIIVDCINNAGDLLQQFSGTSAESIYRQIVLYHLISQSSHGCYLGIQLARAEECLRRNLPFTQDEMVPA